MRALLTGGYGCIGSWIARNLLERGDQVLIYDLKEDPKRLRLILPEEHRFEAFDPKRDIPRFRGICHHVNINYGNRDDLGPYVDWDKIISYAGLGVGDCFNNPAEGGAPAKKPASAPAKKQQPATKQGPVKKPEAKRAEPVPKPARAEDPPAPLPAWRICCRFPGCTWGSWRRGW